MNNTIAKLGICDESTVFIEGSDNVFADLDLPDPKENLLKASIVLEIITTIRIHNFTQSEAALRIGTNQAKVSLLFRGKLKGFSVERLLNFLTLLGRDVDIRVSEKVKNEPGQMIFNTM